MIVKTIVPPGRLDILAQEMLKAGLKMHGNPALRIVAKMSESQIAQALTETLGPGTKCGEIVQKIVNAADDFERKYMEAHRQIRAEDGE
jgi:hypothetical protein